jgi:hypothetical protein
MEACTYGLLLRVRASSYLNKQPILVFHGTTPADLIEKARQFLQTTSDATITLFTGILDAHTDLLPVQLVASQSPDGPVDIFAGGYSLTFSELLKYKISDEAGGLFCRPVPFGILVRDSAFDKILLLEASVSTTRRSSAVYRPSPSVGPSPPAGLQQKLPRGLHKDVRVRSCLGWLVGWLVRSCSCSALAQGTYTALSCRLCW